MTAATVTMTAERAREFRSAREAKLLKLTRMSTGELAAEAGYGVRLFGTYSRDEFLAAALEVHGYGIEQLNEAIHSEHHGGAVWSGCPRCTRSTALSGPEVAR